MKFVVRTVVLFWHPLLYASVEETVVEIAHVQHSDPESAVDTALYTVADL